MEHAVVVTIRANGQIVSQYTPILDPTTGATLGMRKLEGPAQTTHPDLSWDERLSEQRLAQPMVRR